QVALLRPRRGLVSGDPVAGVLLGVAVHGVAVHHLSPPRTRVRSRSYPSKRRRTPLLRRVRPAPARPGRVGTAARDRARRWSVSVAPAGRRAGHRPRMTAETAGARNANAAARRRTRDSS